MLGYSLFGLKCVLTFPKVPFWIRLCFIAIFFSRSYFPNTSDEALCQCKVLSGIGPISHLKPPHEAAHT